MPSHGFGLLAAFALIAASLSAVVLGTQSASAAEPSATHTAATERFVGHQPTNTRATSVKDRADAPQHRAAPWAPLAVVPANARVTHRPRPVESKLAPPTPRLGYDAPTPQGRAPPR